MDFLSLFSVKLGDYQAAADSFEKSLELARRQNDTAAEDAIRRALNEVNEKIVKGVKEGDGDGKRLCSFHFLSVSTPSKWEISNVHEIKMIENYVNHLLNIRNNSM